jgi:hypothetical protein
MSPPRRGHRLLGRLIEDTASELGQSVFSLSGVISVTASRPFGPLTCLLKPPKISGGVERLSKRSSYGYYESRRRYI